MNFFLFSYKRPLTTLALIMRIIWLRVFNFRTQHQVRKYFNNENFPILVNWHSSNSCILMSQQKINYFTPDMGLTLGTSVVVKELTDSGNASKSGVKLGDQLQQV